MVRQRLLSLENRKKRFRSISIGGVVTYLARLLAMFWQVIREFVTRVIKVIREYAIKSVISARTCLWNSPLIRCEGGCDTNLVPSIINVEWFCSRLCRCTLSASVRIINRPLLSISVRSIVAIAAAISSRFGSLTTIIVSELERFRSSSK